jgi:catechol 2,3-dioxygenase-like lactoylglutathione lyase family enzyme
MNFNFVLLYVENPPASAAFYKGLLGAPVVEELPTFCMLPIREGVMLGLWKRDTVEPSAGVAAAANNEIAFVVDAAAEVDAKHQEWRTRGLTIAQPPTDMDFGRTFVGLDPDGHRLRVFAPGAR